MSEGEKTIYRGPGFLALLQLAFIIMKVAGIGEIATWSWWWVFAPFLAGCAFYGCIVLVVLIVLFLAYLADRN